VIGPARSGIAAGWAPRDTPGVADWADSTSSDPSNHRWDPVVAVRRTFSLIEDWSRVTAADMSAFALRECTAARRSEPADDAYRRATMMP
jgi:hypothetical protein